jgi:hypothetical protein
MGAAVNFRRPRVDRSEAPGRDVGYLVRTMLAGARYFVGSSPEISKREIREIRQAGVGLRVLKTSAAKGSKEYTLVDVSHARDVARSKGWI